MISRSVALVALAFLPIAVSATEVTRAQYLMGTVCEIATDGDPREIDAAFSEASRVERFLSTWRDDSELSALNRGDMNAASPELRTLLDRVIMWRDRTSGAFEPRIRPLIDAWQTRGGGTVPSPESIADAMKLIRSGRGAFEEGGFGKGYAIDRMLASTNAPHVVINFGGQIAVRGENVSPSPTPSGAMSGSSTSLCGTRRCRPAPDPRSLSTLAVDASVTSSIRGQARRCRRAAPFP